MQIYVEEDEFLKRAAGTRASASTSSTISYRRDAALKEYIKYLDYKKVYNYLCISYHVDKCTDFTTLKLEIKLQIIIFHKDYSEDNAKFPLFALKVLTKFCGGYEVPHNADRVVLIEKQFALRVFGQGLYCQALRAPYYIAYAAQALILGIAEAENLPIYGKRFFMRTRKLRCAPYMLPLPPPLEPLPTAPVLQFEEDNSEDVEERAHKRMKPTSSPP